MSLTLAVLLLVTYILLYKYFTRNFNYWKIRGVSYVQPFPFTGNLFEHLIFRVSIGDFFRKLYESRHEPFFGIFVFDKPALVIRDPELIKNILVKDFNRFDSRSVAINESFEPLNVHLLFVGKNPEWKYNRKQLSPIFTTGKLRTMVPLMNEIAQEFLVYISRIEGVAVEGKALVRMYSTDATNYCLFNVRSGCCRDGYNEFVKITERFFDSRVYNGVQQSSCYFAHFLTKCFRWRFFDYDATSFVAKVFGEAIRKREAENVQRRDMIDLLIDMKNGSENLKYNIKPEHIVAHALQFFLGGYETTSSTISFALYELSLQKEIQSKLRAEIKSVTETHGGITYDALKDMKYLDQCVSETLRKYPPLPFLDRTCNERYQLPGTDIYIEKNMVVYISILGLHYDSKYFLNPEKFDPERFSRNSGDVYPYSYLPFGFGPRNCIGERFGLINTKIGLANIIVNYEVSKAPEMKDTIQFESHSFLSTAKGGLMLIFNKINQ